jgi:hypothetical protein
MTGLIAEKGVPNNGPWDSFRTGGKNCLKVRQSLSAESDGLLRGKGFYPLYLKERDSRVMVVAAK